MKIRIKGNSVRIRLSRTETEKLATDGYLEEKTNFANGTLTYALQSRQDIDNLDAGFADGTITMYVPTAIATAWAGNNTVGYNNTLPLPDGNSLFLLLEKDFKCVDSDVTEDQSDNYDNPLLSCK
jgi:hypothetical protein